MASPQTENGYTRIANEILESLYLARFSANQFALVLFVIRESYGWSRKTTLTMGLKKIAKATGISRSSVQLALGGLLEMGVINRPADGSLAFNKDHATWGASPLAPGGQPTGIKGPAHWPQRGQPTGLFRAPYKVLKEKKETKKADSRGSKAKCAAAGAGGRCGVYAQRGSSFCSYHIEMTPEDRILSLGGK